MTFRVFAGWDRRQAEAAEVFAYSVRENSSIEAPVSFLKVHELPLKRTGRTDFTFSRFLVPYLCGFEGRALFCDGCDQLCLGDLRELAEFNLRGRPIGVVKHSALPGKERLRPRSWTSLMMVNCSQLSEWTPEYVNAAPDSQLMRLEWFANAEIADLPPEWNALVPPGSDPPPGAKVAHWTALSDPNGEPWIDRSGSAVWADWRARMRS